MRYPLVTLSVLVVGLLGCVAAHAAPTQAGRVVSGGQVGLALLDRNDLDEAAESTALTYRAGYFVANNLALEGRFGIGLTRDADDTAADDPLSLDRLFGVYLTGYLPLSTRPGASLYAAVGYSDVRVTEPAPPSSAMTRSNGLSLGLGAEVIAVDGFRFSVEYMHYVHGDELSASMLSIGGMFTF